MDIKRNNKIFVLMIACVLFSACRNQKTNKEIYSVDELREDFIELRKALENNHPALYLFDTKEEKDNYFDSIFSLINKPQTELQFLRFLAPVVASVKCGHTILEGSEKFRRYFNTKANIISILLYFNNNKAYIYKNFESNSSINPGSEIVSINDRSVEEILNTLQEYLSSDGFNTTYKMWKIYKDFPLHYYQFIDTSGAYKISYISPLDTITSTEILKGSPASIIYTRFKTYNYPQLKSVNTDRNFTMIDSLSTAVFRFSSFINESGISHESYISNIFSIIKEKLIGNLIIDLRGNDGGPPEPSIKLLSLLLEKRFTYFSQPSYFLFGYNEYTYPEENQFNGDVYVLINGGCFSTTGHFCSHLKDKNRVVFIGEETGGNFYCNDNSKEMELSNTGIYIRHARTTFVTDVGNTKRGRGIFPDYEVTPSIDDILSKKDIVMEKAIELIRNSYFE